MTPVAGGDWVNLVSTSIEAGAWYPDSRSVYEKKILTKSMRTLPYNAWKISYLTQDVINSGRVS